ncbi:WcaG Nucleoside-diphosphate-sugar epimerases [Rhabdaerophilaceae bacterium]
MNAAARCVILGFGYSAAAFAKEAQGAFSSMTVTARSEEKVKRLRSAGWHAIRFDGASNQDLEQAIQQSTLLVVSVPPGEYGDPTLRVLGYLIASAPSLSRILYLSTVGVYGDHQGDWVNETSPLRPVSLRSQHRIAAESAWRELAQLKGADLGIFRLSGIYGPGRSAIENLRAGTARRIVKPGQVFNRIHVSDIAGALSKAAGYSGALGTLNLTDDQPAPPQDVVAYAAQMLGLPVPPDIPFHEANLSAMGRSFYGENKRVSNARIKEQLGYSFRCPTYREGLAACR